MDMNNNEGEMEKQFRKIREAKEQVWLAFLETSVGKFLIACVEYLDRLLKR